MCKESQLTKEKIFIIKNFSIVSFRNQVNGMHYYFYILSKKCLGKLLSFLFLFFLGFPFFPFPLSPFFFVLRKISQ